MRRILTLTTLAIAITGCKAGYELSEGTTGDGAEDSGSYFGPSNGFYYKLDFDSDGDFEIERRDTPTSPAADYTLEGTSELLDSGFTRLDIEEKSTDDVDGTIITALRVSDELTFLNPFDDDSDDIIAMVPADDCPNSNLEANYLGYRLNDNIDPSSDQSDIFGTLEYDTSTNELELIATYATDDDLTPQDENITRSIGGCSEGIAEFDNNTYYLANNDTILFTSGTSTTYIGIEERTLLDLDDVDDTYIGFMTNNGSNRLVYALCESGDCTISSLSSRTATTPDEELYTVEFNGTNDPSSGFINGEITSIEVDDGDTDGSGKIACSFNDDIDSVKLMICAGQSPEDDENAWSLIIRSKPDDDSDDGETDSGEADGGEADGGEADGGEADGGETDGGETDGGEADGGEADGGEADGGEADGGTTGT